MVRETLSQKNLHKDRAGGVARGVSPEFKPQYRKRKKERKAAGLCTELTLPLLLGIKRPHEAS
jgi:hypothetical protein